MMPSERVEPIPNNVRPCSKTSVSVATRDPKPAELEACDIRARTAPPMQGGHSKDFCG
jgi:hypothetical protein